ncbi:MFS transporter [Propionibacteriaceae bacterium Y1685]
MIGVLKVGVYRRLFLAQVGSLAGSGLATVALGLFAYSLSGDAAGSVLGTVFAIKMVAYVFVAPLATAAVVRLPPKMIMVTSDLIRVAVAVCLPFVGEVWQIYVLVFALQAASATFTPTFQSVIPQVLPDEDDYTSALSLSRLAYDLEAVLSPMLAALLLLAIPASALFFGTAAGFAASALLVVSAAVPHAAPIEQPQPAPFGKRVREGVSLFFGTPALRPVLVVNLAVAAGGAFVLVQTVVIVQATFGLAQSLVPVLLAANGLGSMAAAFGLPRVLRRFSEQRVILTGLAMLAAATAVVPLALSVRSPAAGMVVVAVLWLAIGLGWSAAETPIGRIIRRHAPTDKLPAAFAAQFSLSHACWLITYPLAGWLGSVGLGATALILAGVATAGTLAAVALWHHAEENKEAESCVTSERR